MRLGTQVGLGLTLLLAVMFGLVGWELLLIERLHDAHHQLASADLEVSRASLRMRLEIDRLAGLTERFFVLRDAGYVAELQRIRDLAATDLDQMLLLPLEPAERNSLLPLHNRWREYTALADEIEVTVPRRREPEEGRARLLAALDAVRGELAGLDREAAERVGLRIRESTARAAAARRMAALVGAGGLVVALLAAVWIRRSTVRPLRGLAAAAQALTSGDFEHRVEDRGPAEIVSLARDFNEMADKLGELDRMKRDFLASVSHDLKAPLASMQEATRLLLEDRALRPDQRRLLELQEDCSQRLQSMIGDLLEVAQLEAGVVEFDLQRLDLVACCRQAVAEAEGTFASGGLSLECAWPETPVMILADSRFLMQALWNLLSNAAKFSPEGGTVRLEVQEVLEERKLPRKVAAEAPAPVPAAVLTVADEGPGIPDSEKTRIFERFYRSRKHERYASGSGLGLAIARSAVEGMRGSIWVEDGPAGGSVFRVLLPVEPARQPA